MTNQGHVLITGATGGLGRRTALNLASRGFDLLIGGRRPDAVDAVCQEIRAKTGRDARPFVADLADLADVRRAVEVLKADEGLRLHGFVANAGINTLRDQRSKDGYELTFAVNVLSHQLLLLELADRLAAGARVVIVSSGVHDPDNRLARRFGIPMPDWIGTRALALPEEAPETHRTLDGRQRYSNSKLANVLQARALQRQLRESGGDVDVFAIDPGLMVDTDLAREIPAILRPILRVIGRLLTPFVDNMRLSPVAAGHVADLISDPKWSGTGFAYFDGDHRRPPSPDALRDDLRDELWRESVQLLKPAEAPI
ncbi:SDR family NAD(P)-dependent oxidoreductase [Enhygromyxa salina]|uniref:Short chain dehydrogenase n=1 Tax=Enhygromyxa salina TaxID=215803 RepID=A0A2S9YS69_9BACT|nr:SDR family NAD(P)-dependent oxidoreductase [Enhygromyxa salina]PRQ07943.1 short chain dehydrogenase [Enhygromyxa salina]